MLRLRPLPLAALGATAAAELAAVPLSWGLEPVYDTLVYAVAGVALALAGALVVTRHPGHPVGWIFLGSALWTALLSDLAQGWGLRAAVTGWSGAEAGQWVSSWSWIGSSVAWTLTLLLLPDGRFATPRWRIVAVAAVVGSLLTLPAWSLSPDRGADLTTGRNPFAVAGFPSGPLLAVGVPLLIGALVASVASVVLRLRRSRGGERAQLRLVVYAASLVGLSLPLTFVLWYVTPLSHVLAAVVLAVFPVLLGAAMLRYRLYQVDVLIDRTVVYGALTAALGAVYLAVSLVVGAAAGRGSGLATAAATLVVAVAFRPLRDRLQRVVDRRFHRERFGALRRMDAFLDDLRADRAAPEDVEAVLRRLLGNPALTVLLYLPESRRYVDLAGSEHPEVGDVPGVWPVVRDSRPVGAVLHVPEPDDDPATVRAVVEQAGLVLEIARLRVELRLQLAEVEASRTRIVDAAHAERRRIERDLHDGAQQRLISIGLALRHAQHALRGGESTEALRTLEESVGEVTTAVTELRELARGLPPAQLDSGLAPAFADLARRAPLPVRLAVSADRFDPRVEGAAWFVGCEGLTNAIKHARASSVVLSAEREDSRLVVRVADDGVGGAALLEGSGLTGLADRVAAIGGVLRIESPNGRGTTLVAELPCGS